MSVYLQIKSVIQTHFQILVKVNEMNIEAIPNCNFDAFEIVDGKKFYCLQSNKKLIATVYCIKRTPLSKMELLQGFHLVHCRCNRGNYCQTMRTSG